MNQQSLRNQSRSFLHSEDNEEVEELTACEVFIQVLKPGLDKPHPLISHTQLKMVIEQMTDVVREQILIQSNSSHEVSNGMYEMLETMAMFCTTIQLQGINQDLFNQITGNDASEFSDSTELSSQNSNKSFKYFYQNVQEKHMFEEKISELI